MLGPRGEESVGLFGAERHEVVDHHPDVGLVSPERERVPAPAPSPTSAAFTPATSPCPAASSYPDVPLICPARKSPGSARTASVSSSCSGKDDVVLDRVRRPEDLRLLQPREAPDDLFLDVRRKGHRQAVQVGPVRVETLGLDEDLVPLPFGEANDLVLDGRAVAGPPASDDPPE